MFFDMKNPTMPERKFYEIAGENGKVRKYSN